MTAFDITLEELDGTLYARANNPKAVAWLGTWFDCVDDEASLKPEGRQQLVQIAVLNGLTINEITKSYDAERASRIASARMGVIPFWFRNKTDS